MKLCEVVFSCDTVLLFVQPAPFWGFWQLRNGSAAEPLIDQVRSPSSKGTSLC